MLVGGAYPLPDLLKYDKISQDRWGEKCGTITFIDDSKI